MTGAPIVVGVGSCTTDVSGTVNIFCAVRLGAQTKWSWRGKETGCVCVGGGLKMVFAEVADGERDLSAKALPREAGCAHNQPSSRLRGRFFCDWRLT